jgi:hypothetical protein
MGTSRRWAQARSGYVRVRVDATLAWGVDLHAAVGQVHPSIADKDLVEPFAGRPDLDAVVVVEPHGRDLDGDLLVINRTITSASGGLSQLDTDALTPPTPAEITAVHAALDHLGYTGPRDITLLIAVDWT